jgi:hypothetical protein
MDTPPCHGHARDCELSILGSARKRGGSAEYGRFTHYGVGSDEFEKKGAVMRMKKKLAVVVISVAALIGRIAATAATPTPARS